DFHLAVERRLLPGMPLDWARLTKIGDTSFFGVGVPTIASRSAFTKEQIAAMGDANLGWWHHTDQSTLERLDRALLGDHLKVYAAYLWGLLTMPILPTRFTPTVRQIVERLEQLLPQADVIELAGPASLGGEALAAVERLDAAADAWRGWPANEIPVEVEQLLNGALK